MKQNATTGHISAIITIFMLPALFLMDFNLEWEHLIKPVYLFNILFLGFGASALYLRLPDCLS